MLVGSWQRAVGSQSKKKVGSWQRAIGSRKKKEKLAVEECSEEVPFYGMAKCSWQSLYSVVNYWLIILYNIVGWQSSDSHLPTAIAYWGLSFFSSLCQLPLPTSSYFNSLPTILKSILLFNALSDARKLGATGLAPPYPLLTSLLLSIPLSMI
jgi:hypothetical protein